MTGLAKVGIGVVTPGLVELHLGANAQPAMRMQAFNGTGYADIESDASGSLIYDADPTDVDDETGHFWKVDGTVYMDLDDGGVRLGGGARVNEVRDSGDSDTDSDTALLSEAAINDRITDNTAWTYTSEGDLTNGGADDLSELEFNSLPSGITEIEVLLDEAGENADDLIIQLSTGTTFVETGYIAGTGDIGNESNYTEGFPLNRSTSGNNSGVMRLVKGSGNKWFASHGFGTFSGGGRINLGGTLDGVRITTNGTGLLNNGTAQVRYR